MEHLVHAVALGQAAGLNQHAHLAAHVDVAVHQAVAGGVPGEAAHGDLLADLGHLAGDQAFHGHALVLDELLGQQRFHVGGIVEHDLLGDVLAQLLELVGLGHEVGLAVDLHQGAGVALLAHVAGDQALGGNAALLLGGGGQALFAQVIDGLFDVAVHGGQGLFAIHHARAGAAAQLHNDFGANFHTLFSSCRDKMGYSAAASCG